MSQATRRAIYGKLAGDTTLNNLLGSAPTGWSKSIYYEFAPTNATFPYVVFHKQAGTPSYGFNKAQTMNEEIWTVKGIDRDGKGRPEGADDADTISARLDTLLTDVTLSISGATQLYLRREGDVNYAESTDGVIYRHSGASFRLVTV